MTTTGEQLAICREHKKMLMEMVREERKRAEMWRRRCAALEALGIDLGLLEPQGLAESLASELGRLRGLGAARSRTGRSEVGQHGLA